MKKKIVSVILVAAMAVGCLAGCGSKEAKNEDAFYIGGIGPVTGDAAIYGTAVQNGAQTVSYTHLDVYKRQSMELEGRRKD